MKCQAPGCMEVAGDGGYCASHLPGDPRNWKKRASDGGLLCRLARVLSLGWDFVDKRDIDKHFMAWAVFGMTFYMADWMLDYIYAHPDKSGLELAAIASAIMVPITPVLGAVVRWYFEARSNP
jgi:hypothetical protein